jgi:hypothetical protein
VRKLTAAQRRLLVERALQTRDQDVEKFLRKVKDRMDRRVKVLAAIRMGPQAQGCQVHLVGIKERATVLWLPKAASRITAS